MFRFPKFPSPNSFSHSSIVHQQFSLSSTTRFIAVHAEVIQCNVSSHKSKIRILFNIPTLNIAVTFPRHPGYQKQPCTAAKRVSCMVIFFLIMFQVLHQVHSYICSKLEQHDHLVEFCHPASLWMPVHSLYRLRKLFKLFRWVVTVSLKFFATIQISK